MERYLRLLQRGIIYFTLFIISVLLMLALIDVFVRLYDGLVSFPFREFIEQQYQELIGLFLMILIGVELLEAIKGFLKTEVLHVELVVLVAIIAIARKVIVWGVAKSTALEMFSLAAMLAALALTYWVIKICYKKNKGSASGKGNCNQVTDKASDS